MSFREKSAWISLISILIPFGIYFGTLARSLGSGHPQGGHHFGLFLACVLGLLVLQVALITVASVLTPKEARAAKDERERLIELKATRIAFFVLSVGALLAVGSLHLGSGRVMMANYVLLALVLAEVVKLGGQIVYYRRGA